MITFRVRAQALRVLVFGSVLSGCGGSGGSTLLGTNPGSTPAAPSNANVRSASASIQVSAQGGSYSMPSVGGISTQFGFSASSNGAGSTLAVTTSLDAPAGATSLQSKLRPESTSTTDVLYYVIFTPSTTISFPSLPTVSITLPNTTPTAGRDFFASISIPPETGAELSFLNDGPATVTGQTVTFAADPHPLTLQAGKQYIFAFYDTRANLPAGPNIHVADSADNAISTFALGANGNVAPTSVLKGPLTGLNAPISIAEDGSGRIYVLNGGAPPGTPGVTIYAPGAHGNVSPVFVITESNVHDSNGPFTALLYPDAIAVTPSSNVLYTELAYPSEFGGAEGAVGWTRGADGNYSATLYDTYQDDGGEFLGLALDPAGNVYQESNVLQTGPNAFGPGIISKNGIISGTLTNLTSLDPIAVSPAGTEVCAIDVDRILCFPTSSAGNEAPVRLIRSALFNGHTDQSGFTTLRLAYDPAGELLVSTPRGTAGNGSVIIFAAGVNGNAVPVRTIAGAASGLNSPSAVTVGP